MNDVNVFVLVVIFLLHLHPLKRLSANVHYQRGKRHILICCFLLRGAESNSRCKQLCVRLHYGDSNIAGLGLSTSLIHHISGLNCSVQ